MTEVDYRNAWKIKFRINPDAVSVRFMPRVRELLEISDVAMLTAYYEAICRRLARDANEAQVLITEIELLPPSFRNRPDCQSVLRDHQRLVAGIPGDTSRYTH